MSSHQKPDWTRISMGDGTSVALSVHPQRRWYVFYDANTDKTLCVLRGSEMANVIKQLTDNERLTP